MKIETIVDAIIASVQRHASLVARNSTATVDQNTRPYPDLGMDSAHDVNIACEVEAILGIELPEEQHLLYEEYQALSIIESATRIAKHLETHPQSIHE